VRELDRRTAEGAVSHLIAEARQQFAVNAAIVDHLDRVREDLIENVAMLVAGGDTAPAEAMGGSPFDRYEVNVVVTQPEGDGAPIVEELHPTLGALTGSIEHISMQGALITNFRLIKAGAIHRANGGYLILNARDVLSEPFSWQALKRALRRREIVIEDVSRLVGLTNTVTLEPDPIPLDLKVVLFGDRFLHMVLSAADAELAEHFKVLADFDDDVERSPESEAVMARLTAAIVRAEGLKPLDRAAVARVVEHAARLADDQARLTLWIDQIRDLLIEADHLCARAGRTVTARADIQAAIEARIERGGRVRDRMQAMTLQDVLMVDTEGARVGMIHGLSVTGLAGASFGRPSRISCRVRPGGGRLIDIEREVELGGPLHSKGVLILSGFLSGRYALAEMMSLQASLVFEQSYGGVDGDSASSAELYCLISALAEVPLRQDLAVTGSVNQQGEIQAIGGVNEKIEGFFDLCAARGLTGTQGVVIPVANVQHLMLRADVVEACAAGRFAIHAVSTIDEGLALMTGKPAGARGADGLYAEGSVNRLVEDRLRAFARVRTAGDAKPGEGGKA
jgi:lon-related putative ATP-dependent protease